LYIKSRVAPLKSYTVTLDSRVPAQKLLVLNRHDKAAVAPSKMAGITVGAVASAWNRENGQWRISSRRSPKLSISEVACRIKYE